MKHGHGYVSEYGHDIIRTQGYQNKDTVMTWIQ